MSSFDRDAVLAWLGENGYTVYADYRDEIPSEWVQFLLDGEKEKLAEKVHDLSFHYRDSDSASYHADQCIEKLGLDKSLKDNDEFMDLVRDEMWFDMDGWLSTAARNTRLNFTATPHSGEPGDKMFEEDQDERLFLFPHGHLSEDENERRRKKLNELFGIEPDGDSNMYEFDELKVLGRLDINELIEKGPPTYIVISPDMRNTIVSHNSVNGSGGLGDLKPTKTAKLPAMFQIDEPRYGVDAVFGFVGEVWAEPLPAEWEENAETQETTDTDEAEATAEA